MTKFASHISIRSITIAVLAICSTGISFASTTGKVQFGPGAPAPKPTGTTFASFGPGAPLPHPTGTTIAFGPGAPLPHPTGTTIAFGPGAPLPHPTGTSIAGPV